MIRKNLIVAIFVLSAIVVALLFLNFHKVGKEEQKAQIFDPTDLGKSFSNYPVRISKSAVGSFVLTAAANRVIFYDQLESIAYESDFGAKIKKEVAEIPDATEIVWGPGGKKAIATIFNQKDFRKAYFDFQNNKKIELNQNIKSVDFSPDGEKIVYHFYEPGGGEGTISISRPDGSEFAAIFKTRIPSMKILWPNDDLIIFYRNDSLEETADLFALNTSGKNFRKLVDGTEIDAAKIESVKWPKDGERFLVSIKDKGGLTKLFWGNESGMISDTGLDINAQKCTLAPDEDSLFCGQNGEIFKYDPITRERESILTGLSLEPVDIEISTLGDYLLFKNNKDARLHSLNIKL